MKTLLFRGLSGDLGLVHEHSSLTSWVVPIDDNNNYFIAWRNLNPMDDPEGRSRRQEIG